MGYFPGNELWLSFPTHTLILEQKQFEIKHFSTQRHDKHRTGPNLTPQQLSVSINKVKKGSPAWVGTCRSNWTPRRVRLSGTPRAAHHFQPQRNMDLQCLKSTVNQQKLRFILIAFRCHNKLLHCFNAYRDFCASKSVKTILAFVQTLRKNHKFGLDLNHIYHSCFSKSSTATNSPFTDFSIRTTWEKNNWHLKLFYAIWNWFA